MKLNKLALLALPFAMAVQADNGQNNMEVKSVVNFSATAEQEVAYDVMQVALYIQEENNSLKTLNQSINDKVNNALAVIKKQSAVEIAENSRDTQVRYSDKGKQNGWSGRATLVLQSKDFSALSQVLGELDEKFAIENINPQLSVEARAALEDQLIIQAMAKFKHKAELLQQSLNAKGYQIVDLSVHSARNETNYARPYVTRMAASPMSETDSVSLENTKTRLKTEVNARIQLTY